MTATPRIDSSYGGRDLAFFGIAVLLLMPSIWSPCSITGQDEYWLSFRTVLEMQERGEWLTPYVNGELRLQKPPLLYWLMRASFLLLGPNLFAARIWTVLAGALMALYTAKLARRYSGSGYLAGVLVLAAAGVAIDARRAMFDLPVGAFCTAAIYYSVTWYAHGRLRAAVCAAVALAAAAMTKGPVALWFYIAAVLAAAATRRARPIGPWWHWLVGVAVFSSLALPWPIWVQSAHPEFWQVMQTQAEHREFGLPPLHRLPQLLLAALGLMVPWSFAVLAAAYDTARTPQTRSSPLRWLLLWIAVGLLPFAFMKAFERYMLALICPMAIVVAHWLGAASARVQRLHATIAAVLIAVPVAVFSLFTLWFGTAYVLPLCALAGLWFTWRSARRPSPDVPRTAVLTAILVNLLLGGIYPSIGINRLPDDLPADLRTTPVQTFARAQPGMLSMRIGRSVPQMDGREEGLGERLAAFHGYLFALEEDRDRIEGAARAVGLQLTPVGSFRSFYSRKAWLKFFRRGIGKDEWLAALKSRSTEPLQPVFVYYRLP